MIKTLWGLIKRTKLSVEIDKKIDRWLDNLRIFLQGGLTWWPKD